MMRKLTYQQLFYVYIISVILGIIVIYNIALKPTFELKKSCAEKQEILKTVVVAPQQIKLISEKIEKLDKQFSSFSSNDNSSRDIILQEISNYCHSNRLIVYNYPPSHYFDNKSFVIETNRIIIKGDFKRLLKLINYIETKGSFSRIVSLRYFIEQNKKTKLKELYLELIFQNIRNHE